MNLSFGPSGCERDGEEGKFDYWASQVEKRRELVGMIISEEHWTG